MRAVWYDRQGPAAEVLRLGDLPDPQPGPGEVRVRVRFSGVNPGDTKKRRGWLGSSMPYTRVIPHSDGAGVFPPIGKEDADRVFQLFPSTSPEQSPRRSSCTQDRAVATVPTFAATGGVAASSPEAILACTSGSRQAPSTSGSPRSLSRRSQSRWRAGLSRGSQIIEQRPGRALNVPTTAVGPGHSRVQAERHPACWPGALGISQAGDACPRGAPVQPASWFSNIQCQPVLSQGD